MFDIIAVYANLSFFGEKTTIAQIDPCMLASWLGKEVITDYLGSQTVLTALPFALFTF